MKRDTTNLKKQTTEALSCLQSLMTFGDLMKFQPKKLELGRTENLGHLLEHSVGYILLIGPDPPVHPHPKLRQSYPGNNPVVNQSLVLKLDCMTPRGLCWPSWTAFSMKN